MPNKRCDNRRTRSRKIRSRLRFLSYDRWSPEFLSRGFRRLWSAFYGVPRLIPLPVELWGFFRFLFCFRPTINGSLRLEAPKVYIFARAHVVPELKNSRVFDFFQR